MGRRKPTGDSSIGYRLPIDSLPHIPAIDYPYVVPADPFAERTDLPDPDEMRQRYIAGSEHPAADRQMLVEQSLKGGRVRTAMTVEPRDGRLCVFMPPTETLEDYLELIAVL